MATVLQSNSLCDGVTFSAIQDSRFKTNRISVNFIEPLSREYVTQNALIPQILKDGFCGCEDFTALNRRLEGLYGARIEDWVQRRGDSQILSLAVTGIDDAFALNGEALTGELADILRGLLFHPLTEGDGFSARYTALEKSVLSDAIDAQINEKRSYTINRLIGVLCEGEPFGIPPQGYKEQLAQITPQSAKRRYDELLSTARVEIIFTGCGDSAPAEQLLREAFSGVERRYREVPAARPHPVSDAAVREEVERLSVSQCKMAFGFGSGLSPQDAQTAAMRLMVVVLGDSTTSKLFVNVREKLSLCYFCAARYDMYKGVMLVDCGVEEKDVETARAAILEQLSDIQNGNVTGEEFQNAVLGLKNDYAQIGESTYSLESFYLGQRLNGCRSTPELEMKKLDELQPRDIVEAAQRLRLEAVYLLAGKQEQ